MPPPPLFLITVALTVPERVKIVVDYIVQYLICLFNYLRTFMKSVYKSFVIGKDQQAGQRKIRYLAIVTTLYYNIKISVRGLTRNNPNLLGLDV